MPSLQLEDAHPAAVPSSLRLPQLQMGGYAPPITRSKGMGAGVTSAEAEWPAETFVSLRDLAKGVGWALAIEGVAALTICSICYLWHLWR